VSPQIFGSNPNFSPEQSRTPAAELVLTYRATRQETISYTEYHPGDAAQFVIPTPESIRAAVNQVKRMGVYCAGPLFFRWPARSEFTSMLPAEVIEAATTSGPTEPTPISIQAVDRQCVAVYCADLYLLGHPPLRGKPSRYRIRASGELEYFLPAEDMPARMIGPSEIRADFPPFSDRGRLRLGRAVLSNRATFQIEDLP
jgi:hypothetical protein